MNVGARGDEPSVCRVRRPSSPWQHVWLLASPGLQPRCIAISSMILFWAADCLALCPASSPSLPWRMCFGLLGIVTFSDPRLKSPACAGRLRTSPSPSAPARRRS